MSLSLYPNIVKTSYRRYTWAANRITPEDMAQLYALKTKTRRPITKLIAEAVALYLKGQGHAG